MIGSEHHPDTKAIEAEYPGFYESYLIQHGLPRHQDWAAWEGFLRECRQVVGHPFSRNAWDPGLINPTLDGGRLSQVARTSVAIRDRYLLAAIQQALREYDRVVVDFGAWHVLALEPVFDDGVLKN